MEAIESCLSQDYPNLEVIVSDNASEDNTLHVIKKYLSDKRFKYFRNDINIGGGKNWIKLLYEYATGEYGILLPDDDYLINKSHISEAMSLIILNKLNIVFSDSFFKDEVKGLYYKTTSNLPNILSREYLLANVGKIFKGIPFFPGLSAVFSLKKARELRAFYPPIYGLDYELSMRFNLTEKYSGLIKGAQRVARGHPENDSRITTDLESIFEGIKMFRRLYDFGIFNELPIKQLKRFRRRTLSLFINALVVRNWLRINGCSLRSIHSLYREISKIYPLIRWSVFLNRWTIANIIKCKSKRLYNFAWAIWWMLNKERFSE